MRIAETIKTNDDLHLTDQGIAAREALMEEIEAIEQDLEAIKQEHGLDQASTIERGILWGCPGRSLCRAGRLTGWKTKTA
jgi:hypothetical protein